MSLIRKSDVKNHLSARYRPQVHLARPDSQFGAANSDAVSTGSEGFARDFLGEHSEPVVILAPDKPLNDSTKLRAPARSSSVQP